MPASPPEEVEVPAGTVQGRNSDTVYNLDQPRPPPSQAPPPPAKPQAPASQQRLHRRSAGDAELAIRWAAAHSEDAKPSQHVSADTLPSCAADSPPEAAGGCAALAALMGAPATGTCPVQHGSQRPEYATSPDKRPLRRAASTGLLRSEDAPASARPAWPSSAAGLGDRQGTGLWASHAQQSQAARLARDLRARQHGERAAQDRQPGEPPTPAGLVSADWLNEQRKLAQRTSMESAPHDSSDFSFLPMGFQRLGSQGSSSSSRPAHGGLSKGGEVPSWQEPLRPGSPVAGASAASGSSPDLVMLSTDVSRHEDRHHKWTHITHKRADAAGRANPAGVGDQLGVPEPQYGSSGSAVSALDRDENWLPYSFTILQPEASSPAPSVPGSAVLGEGQPDQRSSGPTGSSRSTRKSRPSDHALISPAEILAAAVQVQAQGIDGNNPHLIFSTALQHVLGLTKSVHGLMGEVFHDKQGKPYLGLHALTNIVHDEASSRLFDSMMTKTLAFRNLNSLYGVTLRTGQAYISNNAATDPQSCGVPHGHPRIDRYMGLPLTSRGTLIGMVAVIGRTTDYTPELCAAMQPILQILTGVLLTLRSNRRQQQFAEHLQRYRNTLNQRVRRRTAALLELNAKLRGEIVSRRKTEERLAAVTKTKSHVFAKLVHEVKTPLVGIVGNVEELMRGAAGNLTPEQLEAIATINASTDSLMMTVNDILAISKLTEGRMTLSHEFVALPVLLNYVRTLFNARAMTNGVSISAVCSDAVAPVVCTDGHKVLRVVQNFVSNAIKYGESAVQISLSAAVVPGTGLSDSVPLVHSAPSGEEAEQVAAAAAGADSQAGPADASAGSVLRSVPRAANAPMHVLESVAEEARETESLASFGTGSRQPPSEGRTTEDQAGRSFARSHTGRAASRPGQHSIRGSTIDTPAASAASSAAISFPSMPMTALELLTDPVTHDGLTLSALLKGTEAPQTWTTPSAPALFDSSPGVAVDRRGLDSGQRSTSSVKAHLSSEASFRSRYSVTSAAARDAAKQALGSSSSPSFARVQSYGPPTPSQARRLEALDVVGLSLGRVRGDGSGRTNSQSTFPLSQGTFEALRRAPTGSGTSRTRSGRAGVPADAQTVPALLPHPLDAAGFPTAAGRTATPERVASPADAATPPRALHWTHQRVPTESMYFGRTRSWSDPALSATPAVHGSGAQAKATATKNVAGDLPDSLVDDDCAFAVALQAVPAAIPMPQETHLPPRVQDRTTRAPEPVTPACGTALPIPPASAHSSSSRPSHSSLLSSQRPPTSTRSNTDGRSSQRGAPKQAGRLSACSGQTSEQPSSTSGSVSAAQIIRRVAEHCMQYDSDPRAPRTQAEVAALGAYYGLIPTASAMHMLKRPAQQMTGASAPPGSYLLCLVEVQDDGRGISQHVQQQLFNAYVQEGDVEGGLASMEGTGLGLAIVHELAGLFKGAVWVASKEGEGARFSFLWPVKVPSLADLASSGDRRAMLRLVSDKPSGIASWDMTSSGLGTMGSEHSAHAPSNASNSRDDSASMRTSRSSVSHSLTWLSSCRAIIADDERVNQRTMARTFVRAGLSEKHVATACCGSDALAMARTAEASAEHVHVLVLDWNMPNGDGNSTCREAVRCWATGEEPRPSYWEDPAWAGQVVPEAAVAAALQAGMPALIVSSADCTLHKEAADAGATIFLDKPCTSVQVEQVLTGVRRAQARHPTLSESCRAHSNDTDSVRVTV